MVLVTCVFKVFSLCTHQGFSYWNVQELHVGFHIFLCLSFNPKWKEENLNPHRTKQKKKSKYWETKNKGYNFT
jgi:hypothetical protein